jgi:serine/threonine protein kinase
MISSQEPRQYKLIDLAFASRDPVIAGTNTYYAPELLANTGGIVRIFGSIPKSMYQISSKVDIWALGCVLTEMYSGLRLFDFSNDTRRFVGIHAILSSFQTIKLPQPLADKISLYFAKSMQTKKDLSLIN